MNEEPIWISEHAVYAIHRKQIAEHGGKDGVCDFKLLKSALDRPKNVFHYTNPRPDIVRMASCYAFGIIKNHPFNDGNKRTGYVVCLTFLNINGFDIKASLQYKYNIFMKLASATISEIEFADSLRSISEKLS
ncbi:MAG: type II toxin-antitoxin system death-on-curing family toxin [Pseudomonadota bacterium]